MCCLARPWESKEVADYAVVRQDIRGWLFGIGYLGSLDMAWIWPQIVDIAKKNKIVPAVTPTAQARTPPCSWPAVTSTRISQDLLRCDPCDRFGQNPGRDRGWRHWT